MIKIMDDIANKEMDNELNISTEIDINKYINVNEDNDLRLTTCKVAENNHNAIIDNSETQRNVKVSIDEPTQACITEDGNNTCTDLNDTPSNSNAKVDDIRDLYKYVNLIQVSVNKNIDTYIEVWKLLNDINIRLTNLENNTGESIARINGQILVNELQFKEKDNESTFKRIHAKINDNKTQIQKINDHGESVDRIEEKLKSLEAELNNFNNKENKRSENTELQIKYDDIPINHESRQYLNKFEYAGINVDSEYLFITDSNLKRINPDIMNHGTKCAKVYCPTFQHVKDYLDKVNVISSPKVIFFHCGTNCLDEWFRDVKMFEDEFVKILTNVKTVFIASKIVVSSILPRGEAHVNRIIPRINDFLQGCCASSNDFSFMNNVNIKRNMLRDNDNKHVNTNGFRTLLSNVRYTLFGKYPS